MYWTNTLFSCKGSVCIRLLAYKREQERVGLRVQRRRSDLPGRSTRGSFRLQEAQ